MKRYAKILFIFIVGVTNAYGQKNDQNADWQKLILNNDTLSKKEGKQDFVKYNFGPLWTAQDNSYVYGFIGENYQRIRIKITSAIKDKKHSDTYLIKGKSSVKGNISEFSGTIRITKLRIYKKMHWGVDDEYIKKGIRKQGVLIAEYHFLEDKTKTHSGIFDGVLSTSWYIDKIGKLRYDDIERDSDSYRNNQFVGTWKGYANQPAMICNWGDYRIPFSGDLDAGAAEFSPVDKYLRYGWQSLHDALFSDNREARSEEEKQWWK